MGLSFSKEIGKIVDSLRVLLVDDTAIIVDRLSKALGGIAGISIVGASHDSEQAILDIARLSPDLVVLDVQLRDSIGWPVLQSVIATHPQTQVFMFTNDTASSTRQKYVLGGADRYFDKSREFGQLYRAVRELADSSRSTLTR